MKYLLFYFILINILSFFIAAVDKLLAINKLHRVSEKALFGLAVFGGALLMYISMRIFHHKTRHKRFMLGLPMIIILQLFLLGCYFYGVLY